MSPGVGMKTGGRGSWRRKTKKTQKNGNQNGLKVWLAAQRLGCREFGELDSASIILQGSEEALSFQKPELAFNMHANTYAIMGKVEKKPIVEVLTDLISGMNLSGLNKKAEEENNDLGDVPEDVDFSKTEEEPKPDSE
ncbi:putative transcription factor 3b [Histomonas meleagridis]|uniref:putative transcription factor 3b n=1 Tax=Histomonas meleagridis TaxID=135588 RepID=UPI0035595688|nr:putative transcription factor 3b [Histomonas meleagridis]KAH0799969.1 putative transcription factor 3b [Histomonas meleagridis]